VSARAGVTESVFCELFPTVDDIFPTVEQCYYAAFEEGLDRLSRTIADATSRDEAWLERVRSGLVALLGFFDDEPNWARLLVLDTPLNVAVTLECRKRLHDLLTGLLEREGEVGQGYGNGRAAGSQVLLATLGGELLVGGAFSVIRTSLLEADGGKLVELAPSLMAFIVAPYLGQAAAQAELDGRPSGAGEAFASESKLTRAQTISRAAELPVRATHRTTLVLRAIAQAPYSNNREVAQAAGLSDEGQTSKLLARLERQGVIENVGIGAARGEPNAWLLTPSGRRAVDLIGQSLPSGARRRKNARAGGVA
jgi:AcrR family transcriptional regulator